MAPRLICQTFPRGGGVGVVNEEKRKDNEYPNHRKMKSRASFPLAVAMS